MAQSGARTAVRGGRPDEADSRQPDLVLHTSAFTDVDGAEADEDAARRVNVDRTREIAALGAPVLYFSTDYVFDGRKVEPYVESDAPNPQSVYGRTKLEGEREIGDGWIVRSSWLFAPWGKNFVLTMLALGRRARRGIRRRRPARLPDVRRAPRRGYARARRAARTARTTSPPTATARGRSSRRRSSRRRVSTAASGG